MKKILFCIACCCITLGIAAAPSSSPNDIEQLLKRLDTASHMGALVVDLNTGETLYARNASDTFIPASNMKLFSDAAALLALGPSYRFQTELTTTATHLEQGVLTGNIYLYLPGDPSLTTKDLQRVFSELKTWGIKRIKGNVVFVSERQHVAPYAPGWDTKDLTYSYGAPLAPLVLDENRLTVTVNPAARAGTHALIELHPENQGVTLNNEVITKAEATHCGLSYLMDSENILHIKGCIGLGQWSAQQGLAIKNPLTYTKAQVHALLNQLDITLDGKMIYGRKKPKQALLLARHESRPLSELLTATLKTSDNLYADSLFLHTAAVLKGQAVDWDHAEPVIKQFLQQQTGIDFQQARLIDGSGLSRQDRITPEQTVQLLQFLYSRFPLSYEYIAALPVAGRDGTLKKRFKKPSQRGFVRAKTGTMSGIVSLSGYLYTANAHTLAFAIYINKGPKTKPEFIWRYASLIDGLCDFFLKQHPGEPKQQQMTNAKKRIPLVYRASQSELIQNQAKKWRQIELSLKHALKGQPVAVIYRKDQLILDDQSKNADIVWEALQTVYKKHPFSAALHTPNAPPKKHFSPSLLWVKTNTPSGTRTWTLRDAG